MKPEERELVLKTVIESLFLLRAEFISLPVNWKACALNLYRTDVRFHAEVMTLFSTILQPDDRQNVIQKKPSWSEYDPNNPTVRCGTCRFSGEFHPAYKHANCLKTGNTIYADNACIMFKRRIVAPTSSDREE